MPFAISSTRGGPPFKVINKITRKVHGTHPTKEKALAQMRAMYANGADENMSRQNAEKMHGST